MKKLLFATNNPANVKYYEKRLIDNGYQILTLKDIETKIDIKEDGKNAIENAIQKAEPYHRLTNMVTIGIDDNLIIEGLPEERQPKMNVRRVNGKRLTDEEMIKHYTAITKELGGQANAYWIYGIAVCKDGKTYTFEKRNKVIFVDNASPIKTEGYPLDSITISPEFHTYHSELTDEQKIRRQERTYKEIVDFILEKCQ